ncbi:MAG: DUF4389 domain-containing protein [Gammaproteobacteria bacterium]|nr:DUF4389 domain-containing protein [Gammaproteobacteria bacterium]
MNEVAGNGAGGGSIWMRGLFMLLFGIIYSIAEIVVVLLVVFQFFCVLITGGKNARVLDLGRGLSTYVYEILLFETFNSERRPFPFSEWPQGGGPEA